MQLVCFMLEMLFTLTSRDLLHPIVHIFTLTFFLVQSPHLSVLLLCTQRRASQQKAKGGGRSLALSLFPARALIRWRGVSRAPPMRTAPGISFSRLGAVYVKIKLITNSHIFILSSRRGSSERPSRLTSAVKPLMEASAEAVIDIKPDLDDDLIGYDPLEQSLTSVHTQALYSRSTAERPRPAVESSRRTADAYRSTDVTRGQERSGSSHERGYRSSAESSRVSEFRFIQSISSVLL